MTELRTHADVIGVWPNTSEFARTVSRELPGRWAIRTDNARMMRRRKAIPAVYYVAVVAAAARCGFTGITYPLLTELGRKATT